MRAALYVRVSTQEQKIHGMSVETQIDEMSAYCKNKGLEIYSIYNDAGISARKAYTRRPELLRMIKDCQRGLIDIILVTKIDRFFRSVPDYYKFLEQIGDVQWKAIKEDYDTKTRNGQLMINLYLSLAQDEADRTSERERAVLAHKKELGLFHGTPPFGYMLIDKRLQKRPEMEGLMREIYDTYIATRSSSEVQKVLIANGYNVSNSQIKRLLTNPTYYGDAHGIPCPAYITKEEFSMIQSLKKTWSKAPAQTYMFGGLLRCSICGRKLRSTHNFNGKNKEKMYFRYVCRGWDGLEKHSFYSISEGKLEKYLLANIEVEMNKFTVEQFEGREKEVQDNIKTKKKLEGRLQRVGIRYEDGDISLEEYRKKKAEIKAQIDLLVTDLPKEPAKLPEGWMDIYDSLDKKGRKEFWATSIKQITFSGKSLESMSIEWM